MVRLCEPLCFGAARISILIEPSLPEKCRWELSTGFGSRTSQAKEWLHPFSCLQTDPD
jgi:hypothetical protein